MKKTLIALGAAYLIGEIIAGVEVGLAVSAINREKGASNEEKAKSYRDLVEKLNYPSLIKEAKALIKDRH